MSVYKYELIIKEHHLDSYQHVNNATYLALYEEARWELITERGYTFETVHETGLGPIILDVHLSFRRELKLREKIFITFELVSYENKIFKMKQQMLKANDEVASEAVFTGAFFDLKNRKIIPPNQQWLKAVGLE